ncbi:MAG: oligopeptide/dipeptide ABC transporter ATP-binding protein [Pseudomonadota bacterium]
MNGNGAFLSVRDLSVHFPVTRGLWVRKRIGVIRAVDGVSFDVQGGETLGIVGESGCGKSTLGRALLQLARPTSGSVLFKGRELTDLWSERWGGGWSWGRELRDLRKKMQMIFQDPYASLNPRMTAEAIVGEPLEAFRMSRGAALRARVADLMAKVGLDPRFAGRYPHEFSGGQRQRIGIARALALQPELIVADEPISALDVSIQAQILNLLKELQRQLGLTLIFISHDLAAIRHVSDRIAVMYLGKVVELGDSESVCECPLHPYTKALLSAAPIPDPALEKSRSHVRLSGEVPSLLHPPSGCPFHPRCPERIERCSSVVPSLDPMPDGRQVACIVATGKQQP